MVRRREQTLFRSVARGGNAAASVPYKMDTASFILGVIVGVAVSGIAFALTVLLFPRLFRR